MMRMFLVLAVCTLILTPIIAHAETLIVPATSPYGVLSEPLAPGVTYCITVSGVATYAIGASMDAEWQTQAYSDVWEEYDSTWETIRWDDDHDVHDLFVNDIGVQWLGSTDGVNWLPHVYSPNHIYKYYMVGDGGSIKFQVADHNPIQPAHAYYDNSGSLTIDITSVPEPSSLLALIGGLGTLVGLVRIKRVI